MAHPRIGQVTCQHNPGTTGTCRIATQKAAKYKPADYYSNPSYGQACPCCGHNGWHYLYADWPPPACVTEAALAEVYGADKAREMMALEPPM